MSIDIELFIEAPVSAVWPLLTQPASMCRWMVDPDTAEMDIVSDWKPGAAITFKGDLHGLPFESKGTIHRLESGSIFEYDYWSSLSQEADVPENYSLITFRLTPSEGGTLLTFSQRNVTEGTIYQHFRFYWTVALGVMKKKAEALSIQ